jgi:hypothetical protein
MVTNLHNLFDPGDGKSTRQVRIENFYVNNGMDLEPIFRQALDKTLNNDTPKGYRGRGFMATNMNWNVIGLLKETYPERMYVDAHKRDYFLLKKGIRIYFKKLDHHNCPNNIITNNVKSLNSMQLLLNDNPITILYAGFRIREDKYWDDISGSYLLEMKNVKALNWCSSLEDLALDISKNIPEVTPIFTANIPNEIVVRPRAEGNGELGKTAE